MKEQPVPIADHGFIGNLGSAALVRKDGTIDWCCLPHLDSPSVFGALLDEEQGGSFCIRPVGPCDRIVQSYIRETNILQTTFTGKSGIVVLTDWMHMGDFVLEEQEDQRLPILYRHVACTEGTVEIEIVFNPRLDYGRAHTELTLEKAAIRAASDEDHVTLHTHIPFTISPEGARTTLKLRTNEEHNFTCAYGTVREETIPSHNESLRRTTTFWQRWAEECQGGKCRILDGWHEQVTRSALTLKVLTGGNGIAAAATTSLPEIPGGSDNWDYRFHWLRDTSFTLQALGSLGHEDDAQEFLDGIENVLLEGGRRPSDLKVLYPLHGNTTAEETILEHLSGYGGARPVRIGNAAATQHQLDVYGEILETVFRSDHLKKDANSSLAQAIIDIVEYVCEAWTHPDQGIWEMRDKPKQYLYSKLMCWVALDRGIRMAKDFEWQVDSTKWKKERESIRALIMERGWSEKRKSFVQAFGDDVLDATALLIPVLEFLPPDDPHVRSTLAAIEKDLTDGVLVYRSEDRRRKGEGAFGLCSFWLVLALAFDGQLKKARENFVTLLGYANHVGLYAEMIDPESKAFLGNFPQAFTHVGLINAAVYLSAAEGKTDIEPEELIGGKGLG